MTEVTRIRKVERALQDTGTVLENTLEALKRGDAMPSHSSSVWRAYSNVEYGIALLKLHLKLEEPGMMKKNAEEGEASTLLINALDCVSRARQMLREGRFEDALGAARKARDSLKKLLIELRGRR